ncbi:hypothetical protein [Bacillus sp. FSL K6-3431]|uniref:hypothetical protein n=1 Tax=Bacillus sp. FSL K6-3431 TaxID=2921500 RepID=UPI0030F719CB
MKLIKWAFIAFSIALIVSGCSHGYGAIIVPTEDIQQLIDDQQTGFVIITNETDATFLDEVQKALLEKKENALLFNVFRNDGENENTDGLSKNPFRTVMPHVNAIYYIKDGTVYDEFNLEVYEGIRQQEELAYFMKKMSNSTGDSNE